MYRRLPRQRFSCALGMLSSLGVQVPCRFVRYADDSNIYDRSERAGQRVMESIARFIAQKLKLKVNEAKSAVTRPQERKFLGFSFTADPELKRAIARGVGAVYAGLAQLFRILRNA